MALSLSQIHQGKWKLILALLTFFISSTIAQECSATKLCATGCCSQFGFCGTGDDHCGKNCLSTCDYKLGCDKDNPCPSGKGCCSKFGFCGLGPDYCAPRICVANCDRKSYCDPGYGAPGYSEVKSCPLNVCCSKWGFCGLTEEFCGKKTVKRPACSSSGLTKRVVGYYEGWANRRVCQRFTPAMIPLGVYTHINFAFASIDPHTFRVVPGSPGDIELYREVTLMKKLQPDLKVFIAIGGWTFNDPGVTATTFSELAASADKQKKFFTSLSSFMSTYNFDGVDIDWEYPSADDRSGKVEDFANFPSFIENLRSHLTSTGGRGGLSITLPAAYWYLQHFDIVKLQRSVEFFNIMTYDLHGLWDKKNKWLGNFLNAHTNLTEITTYLDLLWRNNINPSKVNLGLAFYARTFAMKDSSCTTPGCFFSSAGDAGACTNSVGTLSNAEIEDHIKENNLTPIHYTDAAVKVITWGDQWVAYDDADTYQQKAKFARSQCLGDVMIWALSQDSSDLKSSMALVKATGSNSYATYKKAVVENIDSDTVITRTYRNRQCRWSDCGASCATLGDGFFPVLRSSGLGDDEAGKVPLGELIQDSSYCGSKSILRQFCCPPENKAPACAHFYFNNGRCNADSNSTNTCTRSGYVEIGSVNQYCNSAETGGHEQICCTTDTPSMTLYNQCMWNGKPGKCDIKQSTAGDNGCPNTKFNSLIANSSSGSGGIYCGQRTWEKNNGNLLQQRDYCCANDQENQRWSNCDLGSNVGPVPPGKDPKKWCRSGCPASKVRVAMDNAFQCYEGGGAQVWCCDDNFTYTNMTIDPQLVAYKKAIADFTSNTTAVCEAYLNSKQDPLSMGWDFHAWGQWNIGEMGDSDGPSSSKLKSRDLGDPGTSNQLANLLFAILTGPIDGDDMLKAQRNIWDDFAFSLKLGFLSTRLLKRYVENTDLTMTPFTIAYDIPCKADEWNDAVEQSILRQRNTTSTPKCPLWVIPSLDSSFFDEDQDYQDSQQSTVITRELVSDLTIYHPLEGEESEHTLEKRKGASRRFKVTLTKKPDGSPGITIVVVSDEYPNGKNGQAFVDATGQKKRYAMGRGGNCAEASYIQTEDASLAPAWVVEHIFELQTVPRNLEFLVSGRFPEVVRGGIRIPEYRSINGAIDPSILTNFFNRPNQEWEAGALGVTTSPSQRLMSALGGVGNTRHLVLMDAVGNQYKTNLWNLNNPVSKKRWSKLGFNSPTRANGEAAFATLVDILGVLSYLNQPEVSGHLNAVVQALYDSLLSFQNSYNANRGNNPFLQVMPLWREGVIVWAQRMDTFTRQWLVARIQELRAVWQDVADDIDNDDADLQDFAVQLLIDLLALQRRAESEHVPVQSFSPDLNG